jgi:AraC-like DNA-binding protein
MDISRPCAPLVSNSILTMSITCFAATLAALILLPLILLLWCTESRQQRARRWRRDGWTQQRIADRLGCSRTTVRRLLTA